jgi:hypothetical protein
MRVFRLRRTNFLVQALDPTAGDECRLGATSFRGVGWTWKGAVMPTLSKLLLENGLPDLPVLLIEPHRNHRGIWRIKFSYETGEPFSMAATQASIMVSRLHEIGEVELADEIDGAMKIATRYATMWNAACNDGVIIKPKEIEMAKGEQKGNREAKKPKKEKIKTIAAAPSQKAAGWQPGFASGKKK